MLKAIFKFLWYVFWGLILYKVFLFFFGGNKKHFKENRYKNYNQNLKNEKKIIKSKAFKDPICGTFVDPEISEKYLYKGKTYYFCSKECREKFIKNLDKK